MSTDSHEGIRCCRNEEQNLKAKQLIESGRATDNAARHCELTEPELRCEDGLPQRQSKQVRKRQRRLRFSIGSK